MDISRLRGACSILVPAVATGVQVSPTSVLQWLSVDL